MRGAATVDGVAATSCGGGREPGAAVCVAALPAERCWSADGGGAGGQQAMVQVVDYGSVPAAASRPLASKARRAGFIRFAAVATLALGALAAVIVVGQTRPGTFVHAPREQRPLSPPSPSPFPTRSPSWAQRPGPQPQPAQFTCLPWFFMLGVRFWARFRAGACSQAPLRCAARWREHAK